MPWLIVGSVVAVLAVGGHLLTRGWPLVPRLMFATGLLVAAPTLIAQGLGGTAWIFGQLSPVSGPLAWLVLVAPAGVTAGLLALLRGVPWFDLGRLPLGLMAVALVLFAVVTAPILAFGISNGEPQQAEHGWRLEVEPADPGSYRLFVPFLAWEEEPRPAVLETLADRVAVVAGQGHVELTWEASLVNVSGPNGSQQATLPSGPWVIVEAEGPVTVETRYSFYGSVGDREAFTGYRVHSLNATTEGQAPDLDVRLALSFSGGSGHTCWADGEVSGTVPSDEVGRLGPREPWEPIGGAGDGWHLPVVCA